MWRKIFSRNVPKVTDMGTKDHEYDYLFKGMYIVHLVLPIVGQMFRELF